MTKTLTEQWREGTLPAGTYYIVNKNGDEEIDRSIAIGELWNNTDLKEVLSIVPSYDELKRLQKQLSIATKALKRYSKDDYYSEGGGRSVNPYPHIARKALKEMEGVK